MEVCWQEGKIVQPLWKILWKFFKKLNAEKPYDLAIPLLGIKPKELKKRLKQVFTQQCHCSIIHNSQKAETTQESINGWRDKRGCVYPMECFSAIKRNKFLVHTVIQMNHENIIQSKIRQAQEDRYCFHFYEITRIGRYIEKR